MLRSHFLLGLFNHVNRLLVELGVVLLLGFQYLLAVELLGQSLVDHLVDLINVLEQVVTRLPIHDLLERAHVEFGAVGHGSLVHDF